MFEKLRSLVKGKPSFDLSLSRNYTVEELQNMNLQLVKYPYKRCNYFIKIVALFILFYFDIIYLT